MIKKLSYIESENTVPYQNLAMEEYLLLHCGKEECILYLWQNRNTVVIGRNQNVWKECLVSKLEEENGYPVRRLSGGEMCIRDSLWAGSKRYASYGSGNAALRT